MEAKEANEAHAAAAEGAAAADKLAPAACTDAPSACGHEDDLIKLLPLASMPSMELRNLVHEYAVQTDQVVALAKVRRDSAAPLRHNTRTHARTHGEKEKD